MLYAEQIAETLTKIFSEDAPSSSSAGLELRRWRQRNPIQHSQSPGEVGAHGNCSPESAGVCEIDLGRDSYSLWLELVEDCNLDCVFCYNPWRPTESSLRGRKRLTSKEYLEAVSLIMSAVHIDHVTLSGGEPLMFSKLNDLMSILREKNCGSIGMTTNGRSLTRRRLHTLVGSGLTHISVPLHSHRPETHNSLAAGNSWGSALRALALGIEYAISVTLSCVVTSRNIEDVPRVIDIVRHLGLRTVVLNCMHETGQGKGRADLSVSANQFEKVTVYARKSLEGYSQVLVGSPPQDRTYANNRIDRIVISPHGDVKLCNQSRSGVLNLNSDTSEKRRTFLSSLTEGKHDAYLAKVDNCTCRNSV